MGPFDQTAPWSMESIRGCGKFLDRVWHMQEILVDGKEYSKEHEKMMHNLGETKTINETPWPKYDETKTIDDEIEIPVQVNGKVKAVVLVAKEAS